MKKTLFLLIFFIAIPLPYLSSQEKITNGYNNLKWGSSIKEVNLIYPSEEIRYDQHGVRKFIYEKNNMSLSFFFFADKLFKAGVVYDDINITYAKTLAQNLVAKYGEFDDLVKTTNENDNKTYTETVHLDRFFSANLAIMLTAIDIYNQANNYLIDSACAILYYDPIIETEVEKKAIEELKKGTEYHTLQKTQR